MPEYEKTDVSIRAETTWPLVGLLSLGHFRPDSFSQEDLRFGTSLAIPAAAQFRMRGVVCQNLWCRTWGTNIWSRRVANCAAKCPRRTRIL